MNYLKLQLFVPDRYHELLIAELLELDFYGFEQFDGRLDAYIRAPAFSDTKREQIEQLLAVYPEAEFREIGDIEEKNWNETWEQTIRPQRIGGFLIKPTWSFEKPSAGEILLEIDPKMAFGTGYHATTKLMLRQLEELSLRGKTVLDAGTGTGILAIAAVKLGAEAATGFDIDPWSEKNATENALINGTGEKIDIRAGGFEQIGPGEVFDLVLANINRNVILDNIETLTVHTRRGGILCLSGLLETDEAILREAIRRLPLHISDLRKEEEWILFQLQKSGR